MIASREIGAAMESKWMLVVEQDGGKWHEQGDQCIIIEQSSSWNESQWCDNNRRNHRQWPIAILTMAKESRERLTRRRKRDKRPEERGTCELHQVFSSWSEVMNDDDEQDDVVRDRESLTVIADELVGSLMLFIRSYCCCCMCMQSVSFSPPTILNKIMQQDDLWRWHIRYFGFVSRRQLGTSRWWLQRRGVASLQSNS